MISNVSKFYSDIHMTYICSVVKFRKRKLQHMENRYIATHYNTGVEFF